MHSSHKSIICALLLINGTVAAQSGSPYELRNVIPGECGLFEDDLFGEDSAFPEAEFEQLKTEELATDAGNPFLVERSLLIRDPKVVESLTLTYDKCTTATAYTCPSGSTTECLPNDLSLYRDLDGNGSIEIKSADYFQPPQWSVGYLFWQLAIRAGAATTTFDNKKVSDFVLGWMGQFNQDNPNSACSDALKNSTTYNTLFSYWPKLSTDTSQLDIKRAPFRLLAILNRMDLASAGSSTYASGGVSNNVGEGRLVFGLYNPTGSCTNNSDQKKNFTIIFEYKLPCYSHQSNTTHCHWDMGDLDYWTSRWTSLNDDAGNDNAYVAKLSALTKNFTSSFAGSSTGNNLLAFTTVRTNDQLSSDQIWRLREFKLSGSRLILSPTANTPRTSYNKTSELTALLKGNYDAVLRGAFSLEGAGASAMRSCEAKASTADAGSTKDLVWQTDNISADGTSDWSGWPISSEEGLELRHDFAINTCSGCHGIENSALGHQHISGRKRGSVSGVSAFLGAVASSSSNQLNDYPLTSGVDDRISAQPYYQTELYCRMLKFRDLVQLGTDDAHRETGTTQLPEWVFRSAFRSH